LCQVEKIDYVLVQEPLVINNNVYAFEGNRSHISKDTGAAVIVMSNRFQTIHLGSYSSRQVTAVRVTYGLRPQNFIILVSTYFKYNQPTVIYTQLLDQILVKETRTLIGADTNGHSKIWFSASRNRRGRLVEEFIKRHGLAIHNREGQMNTFCRQDGRTSNIDVTLSTLDIKSILEKWEVRDLTDSDHRVISFNLSV